jgi:hypothetical protein
VVISAIDGMAGIGKTALAVHAAHRLAERFPDGQLFIDLHGYTQGYPPREPGEALEALLRALGASPGQIPQDVEERAALYRRRRVPGSDHQPQAPNGPTCSPPSSTPPPTATTSASSP